MSTGGAYLRAGTGQSQQKQGQIQQGQVNEMGEDPAPIGDGTHWGQTLGRGQTHLWVVCGLFGDRPIWGQTHLGFGTFIRPLAREFQEFVSCKRQSPKITGTRAKPLRLRATGSFARRLR
jgi:hypothetical protein